MSDVIIPIHDNAYPDDKITSIPFCVGTIYQVDGNNGELLQDVIDVQRIIDKEYTVSTN